ncbi:PREDICTED: uncharacterized protein LOC106818200 [Priapulus caudatus]|uniref:Uncharacterized protein LOC106818200 n=1 Tax=Priapulus caudatus TaxID=37621 RepID=A0ABM1F1U0_PRICU|nr:PREDICTED: uncharacterized protein LOC106818200 [Priapulus caudatus]
MARRKQSVPTFAASSFSEEGATDSKRQRLEIKDEPFNVEEYEIHSSSESEPSHSGGATDLHEPRLTSSGYSDTEQALSSDGASAALAFNDGNTSPLSALRNLSGTCAHQVPIGGAVNHYGSVLPNQHDDVNQAGQQRMPAVPSNVGSHDGLPANSDDLSSLECSFRFKVETEYPVVTCLRGNSIDTGEEINMFKCHLCNKMFMTLSGVQQHLALHVAKDITRLLPEAKLPPPDDTPSAISGRMPSASDSYSKQLSSRQWSSPLLQGHGSTRALQCDADERSGGRVPLARRDEGKQQAEQPELSGRVASVESRLEKLHVGLEQVMRAMGAVLNVVKADAGTPPNGSYARANVDAVSAAALSGNGTHATTTLSSIPASNHVTTMVLSVGKTDAVSVSTPMCVAPKARMTAPLANCIRVASPLPPPPPPLMQALCSEPSLVACSSRLPVDDYDVLSGGVALHEYNERLHALTWPGMNDAAAAALHEDAEAGVGALPPHDDDNDVLGRLVLMSGSTLRAREIKKSGPNRLRKFSTESIKARLRQLESLGFGQLQNAQLFTKTPPRGITEEQCSALGITRHFYENSYLKPIHSGTQKYLESFLAATWHPSELTTQENDCLGHE